MAQESLPFDTHRFVQNLVASGFTEKQAEELAYEQIRLLNTNLATKADIEALRLSTEAKIESAKLEMVKWMIGAMVAQSTLIVGLTVAMIKLL
jgi:hypothetical protein